jgi:hypothetical protein
MPAALAAYLNHPVERTAHSARFFTHGRLYMWAAAHRGR